MNHIAHFLLAPQTVDGTIGTLLADFHRGAISPDLPEAVASALRLHRAVDSETDCLPVVQALKASFDPAHRRFAGPALDLYFDHCLARDWARHSIEPFDSFVDAVYGRLGAGLAAEYVPERMRAFAAVMRERDWLRSYRDFAGVEAALGRLNHAFRHRFQREVELRPLAGELRRLQAQCDAAFDVLWASHLKSGPGTNYS